MEAALQEWLLLTALAFSPTVHDDGFASRENCLVAGRTWYAQVSKRSDYRKLCRPSGMIDRCKFMCISASGQNQ
jgi:hypothetical protein